jgi:hypothetical protein
MTAAEDRRAELEAVIRRQLTSITKRPHTANECTDAILKAADAYAKAYRKPPAPRDPREVKPPAVHYAPIDGLRTACRPYDHFSATRWAVTANPQAVTCGHCRKTDAWQAAGRAGDPP